MIHFFRRVVPVFVLLTGAVQAQEGDAWNGLKVVTKYARAIRFENRTVDDGTRFRVYKVEKNDDGILSLVSGEVKGWIWASDVVPYDKAIDFYTDEILDNPNNASAFNWRGLLWSEKGNLDQAIADFDAAIKINAGKHYPYNNRGLVWQKKKDFDKAIADFNEAIRLDEKNLLAHSNRGQAWRKKKEYDKALADFNEAIRLDPKFAPAYNERAWLWATCRDEKFRDGKQAVESATKACELTAWKNPSFLDTLAAAYAELGYFGQAIDWQRKAVEHLDKSHPHRKDFAARMALYKGNQPYRED